MWGWSRTRATLVAAGFLVIDLSFFAANIVKVPQGGWLPLLIAAGDLYAHDHLEDRPADPLKTAAGEVGAAQDPYGRSCRGPAHARPGHRRFHVGQSGRHTSRAGTQSGAQQGAARESHFLDGRSPKRCRTSRRSSASPCKHMGKGFHRSSPDYGFMEDPSIQDVLASLRREKAGDLHSKGPPSSWAVRNGFYRSARHGSVARTVVCLHVAQCAAGDRVLPDPLDAGIRGRGSGRAVGGASSRRKTEAPGTAKIGRPGAPHIGYPEPGDCSPVLHPATAGGLLRRSVGRSGAPASIPKQPGRAARFAGASAAGQIGSRTDLPHCTSRHRIDVDRGTRLASAIRVGEILPDRRAPEPLLRRRPPRNFRSDPSRRRGQDTRPQPFPVRRGNQSRDPAKPRKCRCFFGLAHFDVHRVWTLTTMARAACGVLPHGVEL